MNEDIANFSSPSLSQLHTPSRSRYVPVFSSLPQTTLGPISTGLEHLDKALVPPPPVPPSTLRSSQLAPSSSPSFQPRWSQLGTPSPFMFGEGGAAAGIRRREVTEIIGPRGVGKTSLVMAVAAKVLGAGQSVVWIDTAGPVCSTHLEKMVQQQKTSNLVSQQMDSDDLLKNFLHFQPTSIAHLMALLSHPPSSFPPPNTGLIVLDSVSCLFGSEFRTRMPDPAASTTSYSNTAKKVKNTAAEIEDRESKLRWKLIGEIVGSLKRLAVLSECAVITVNEMVSRFRPGQLPMLHEAISGVTWDAGVFTRILVYWQWLPASVWEKLRMKRVRIAEVAKVAGTLCGERKSDRIVPFVINDGGISEFTHLHVRLHSDIVPPGHQAIKKRKIDEPGNDQVGARQRIGLESEREPADEQSYGEWQDIEAEMAAGILSGYTSSDSDEGVEESDAKGDDDTGKNAAAAADDGGGGVYNDADEEDFQSLLEEVELD